MVMDMGSHILPGIEGSHLVCQVLVPGLEERAREFPALSTMILKTGEGLGNPSAWTDKLALVCTVWLPAAARLGVHC